MSKCIKVFKDPESTGLDGGPIGVGEIREKDGRYYIINFHAKSPHSYLGKELPSIESLNKVIHVNSH